MANKFQRYLLSLYARYAYENNHVPNYHYDYNTFSILRYIQTMVQRSQVEFYRRRIQLMHKIKKIYHLYELFCLINFYAQYFLISCELFFKLIQCNS